MSFASGKGLWSLGLVDSHGRVMEAHKPHGVPGALWNIPYLSIIILLLRHVLGHGIENMRT
jgi:hypothetical protein